VGIGGTSGMVTDDSEKFKLDKLESEVVGRARPPDLLSYILPLCKHKKF